MQKAIASVIALLLACAGAPACGGSQSRPEAPSTAGSVPEPSAKSSPGGEAAPSRSAVTAEACEASGGSVVGDIGDGAIHRADYRCPSGKPPSGDIRAPAGGPMGVEGSVCCPR